MTAEPNRPDAEPHPRPEAEANPRPDAGPDAGTETPDAWTVGQVSLVRGRVLAAAVGVLGVLLALPTLPWPTHTMSVSSSSRGVPDFEQSFWSWGRYADTTPGSETQFDSVNAVALGFFVLALVVGLVATLTYAFLPGTSSTAVAAAGLGWVAVAVTNQLATRVGDMVGGLYGDNPGIVVTVRPAGWFQTASAALLLLALGLVLARPALDVARPVRRAVSARFGVRPQPSGTAAAGRDERPAPPAPRVGVARLQDRPRRDPAPSGSEGVGFTDVAHDDDRFEPPGG